jgi:hypothetical protein
MQTWIEAETRTADFGDLRLDRRFALILDRLSEKPSLSLPAACNGLAETMAAYRFFDNENVAASKVLQPHADATLQRVREQAVVIAAQDTTEVDCTRAQEKVGGPLNDLSRWGLFVHPLLVMTPQRVPLGVVHADLWSRDADEFAKSQQEKRKARRLKSIEEKESQRWLEGYRQACALAELAPQTQVICVSDSESDIYEYFVDGNSAQAKADWIVRACQDRALTEEAGYLRQRLLCTTALGTLTVRVSKRVASTGDDRKRRQSREARQAKVTVRATRVCLRGPTRPGGRLGPVFVNAILVLEENPPAGAEPIEWLLLTNLPIETFADVCQVIDYYCCRWEIEVFFHVLKSGCKIEELQLEKESRLQACLAVYLIVAWRVLYVLMLGREQPELPCTAVLSEAEWKSVYRIANAKAVPKTPPSLGAMVELIAELGGYLGRKHDGPPGPQVMWIGIQRMRDFATAWNSFGPDAPGPKDV